MMLDTAHMFNMEKQVYIQNNNNNKDDNNINNNNSNNNNTSHTNALITAPRFILIEIEIIM